MKDMEGCALSGRTRRRGGAAAWASGRLSKQNQTSTLLLFSVFFIIAALVSNMHHTNRPEGFSTVFIFLVIKEKTVRFSDQLLQPLQKKYLHQILVTALWQYDS